MSEAEKPINFRPIGTTNYYPFTFNEKTKERNVLYSGAVPLHKITDSLYDLYCDYIETPNKNTDYYLSALIKNSEGDRPSYFPIIVKLDSKNTRKERLKFSKKNISKTIEIFHFIYDKFITKEGLEKDKYRKDTNFSLLIQSFENFKTTIVPQLQSLCK